MQCPYCGSVEIWYGPTRSLHVVRFLLSSSKRHCRSCDKKWIAKHSRRIFSLPVFFGMVLIAILSVVLIEEMGSRNYYEGRVSSEGSSGWTVKNGEKGPLTLGSANLGPVAKLVKNASSNSSSTKISGVESLAANAMGIDPHLVEKAKKKFKEDPNFLKKLSPSQRKRAEEKAKQYGFSLPN